MHAGRRQQVAVGGQTLLSWRLSQPALVTTPTYSGREAGSTTGDLRCGGLARELPCIQAPGNAALALLPLARQASSKDKDAARADARLCLVVQRWFASRLVYLRRRLRRGVGEQVPGQAVG